MTGKLRKKKAGKITSRTFLDLNATTDRLIDFFGRNKLVDEIAPDDFARLGENIAETCGVVRQANEITRIKSVFKFAFEADLMDRPVKYGPEFVKPDKSVLRRHKAKNGKKTIEALILRETIAKADPVLRAMILLGVNCGYGNTDISDLQQSMIDFQRGWIDFPRGKTGVERRCPLWKATITALRKAIAIRPAPADLAEADCVFLTPIGKRCVYTSDKCRVDAVTKIFAKLAKDCGVAKGIGFYSLRHVFQSVADTARDPISTKYIMGHVDASMSGAYREWVADENLARVSEHVRQWLLGHATEGGAK